MLWILPGGLGSLLYRARDAYLRSVARRRNMIVPSLIADAADPEVLTGTKREAVAPVIDEQGEVVDRAPKFFKYFAKRPIPNVNYFSYPDLALSGGTPNLLSLRSVDVAYGQVQVLFGVSLELREGETIALLGTNGAGKSTVLRAVSGLVAPKQGSISHLGVDISGLAPHRVAERGLIQVPGGKGVFPSLTVAENLRVGVWMHRRDRVWVKEATAQVLELFPGLRSRLNDPAAQLSGGQQQMLALAMAFLAKPKVLMIDELSLGLAPLVVEQLLNVVKEFKAQGMTVVLVEQSVNVALTAASKAFFMEKGAIRFHGLTAELLERPELLRSIFLEGAAASQDTEAEAKERVVAERGASGEGAHGQRWRACGHARDPRHHQAVRGHHRRRPRVDQAPRRGDPRDHRAERRGQDHAVRPHLRVPRARRRPHPVPGPRRHQAPAQGRARSSGSRGRSRTRGSSAPSRCTRRCASRSTAS